ncbi:response regulator [Galbibacter pacificus]|uniref:Response regulator n=1 Tax=Galbibacter pacificus TaxID=2996052 RepID=A0ABT6FN72_9FLAO|nr:response regulator [Galbibacter pacificus]MDG3581236.1 response regulator [Galbibacter pacificus]MDG3584714.1 response regulator [Galbibacter pacificus]
MKKENYNVVLLDDHRIFTRAIRDTLIDVADHKLLNLNIIEVHSSDETLAVFNRVSSLYKIDYLFLDINLPPSLDNKIISGEDLGLKIRKEYPETRIIIATTHNEPFRIHNILQSINPEGFMVKNDLKPDELNSNLSLVLNNEPYYSPSVWLAMRSYVAKTFTIDEHDRRILYELSQGGTLNDMDEIIPLAHSTLLNRKSKLRTYFNVKGRNDRELVRKAKEMGFI